MKSIQIKIDDLALTRFDELALSMCDDEGASMPKVRSYAFEIMVANYNLLQQKLDEQAAVNKKLLDALDLSKGSIQELSKEVDLLKSSADENEATKSQLARLSESHEMLQEKYDSVTFRLGRKTDFNDSLITSMRHILNEWEV
jgi:predicted nuclease with TOPRIM domain